MNELSSGSQVWYRCDHERVLHDPFEPAYLQVAFTPSETKPFHLLHLIFGEEWDKLRERHGLLPAPESDPLTQVYKDLCMFAFQFY